LRKFVKDHLKVRKRLAGKPYNLKDRICGRIMAVAWKVRAIRGATTASENTVAAIREVVVELLDEIESRNQLDPEDIVNVIFTATADLDAVFPAAIARERSHWDNVPLLDLQQMHVEGSLERCIRVLIQINTLKAQSEIFHPYLRQAQNLRPDWNLAQMSLSLQDLRSLK
jgi:chorismate mutase